MLYPHGRMFRSFRELRAKVYASFAESPPWNVISRTLVSLGSTTYCIRITLPTRSEGADPAVRGQAIALAGVCQETTKF